MVPAEAVERFRADFERIAGDNPERLGVAVSGGPDSLALLLLAAAAYPSAVEAATVDHDLRPESSGEAEHVGVICARLGVPHAILPIHWPSTPVSNVPARARAERYRALSGWAAGRGLRWVATAHHVDDQAETVLMRLARGSGIGGLAGVQPSGRVDVERSAVRYVRPLLGWRKQELVALVDGAGLAAVDDPTNRDERLDRTRVRSLLAENPWLDPHRIARSAAHLGDAEAALAWLTDRSFAERARHEEGLVLLDVTGLPGELVRRLVLRAMAHFTDPAVLPGPKVARLIETLGRGAPATLAGVKVMPGPPWRFEQAPPHRGRLDS